MASRLSLHEEFCEILGSRNAYFNPPESAKMNYDAIRYKLDGDYTHHANNRRYKHADRYQVILITRNPDSPLHMKILEHFQTCSFDRSYTADNLTHFVYTLYY